MANVLYPKYKEALLSAASNVSLASGPVKAVLIDTDDYTYDAGDEFLDDVLSVARIGTPQAIANVSVTGGLFDGDDVTFSAVTGDRAEAILIFIDTGTEGTSRLVAYIDTGVTGLPITPNGGDISIAWNASGILQL